MDEPEALRALLLSCGADIVGYADASPYFGEYTTAIVIGTSAQGFSDFPRNLTSTCGRLDYLGGVARQWLTERGHGFAGPLFSQEQEGRSLPSRALALSCGVGWLGKNGLVVTEKFGPRIDFSSVLSTLPFSFEDGGRSWRGCRDCVACIEACPTGMLSGRGVGCTRCGLCLASCPVGREYEVGGARCPTAKIGRGEGLRGAMPP